MKDFAAEYGLQEEAIPPVKKKDFASEYGLADDAAPRKKDFVAELGIEDPESKLPERSWGDVLNDVTVSAAKGGMSLVEGAVGLADLIPNTAGQFGGVGKWLEEGPLGIDFEREQEFLNRQYSAAQQARNKAFSDAPKTVGGKVDALIENPSVGVHGAIQSIPSLVPAGIYGQGIKLGGQALNVGGKVLPKLAPYIGEGIHGMGSWLEGTRQQTKEGTLTPTQVGQGAVVGLGTGTFSALGGALANKLGVGDADTFLFKIAKEPQFRKTAINEIKKIPLAGLVESLAEEVPQSLLEKAMENEALGKHWSDGLEEAGVLGFATGFGMGSTAHAVGIPKSIKDTAHLPNKGDASVGSQASPGGSSEAELIERLSQLPPDSPEAKELEDRLVEMGALGEPATPESPVPGIDPSKVIDGQSGEIVATAPLDNAQAQAEVAVQAEAPVLGPPAPPAIDALAGTGSVLEPLQQLATEQRLAQQEDAWTREKESLTRALPNLTPEAADFALDRINEIDQLKAKYGAPNRVPQPQHNTDLPRPEPFQLAKEGEIVGEPPPPPVPDPFLAGGRKTLPAPAQTITPPFLAGPQGAPATARAGEFLPAVVNEPARPMTPQEVTAAKKRIAGEVRRKPKPVDRFLVENAQPAQATPRGVTVTPEMEARVMAAQQKPSAASEAPTVKSVEPVAVEPAQPVPAQKMKRIPDPLLSRPAKPAEAEAELPVRGGDTVTMSDGTPRVIERVERETRKVGNQTIEAVFGVYKDESGEEVRTRPMTVKNGKVYEGATDVPVKIKREGGDPSGLRPREGQGQTWGAGLKARAEALRDETAASIAARRQGRTEGGRRRVQKYLAKRGRLGSVDAGVLEEIADHVLHVAAQITLKTMETVDDVRAWLSKADPKMVDRAEEIHAAAKKQAASMSSEKKSPDPLLAKGKTKKPLKSPTSGQKGFAAMPGGGPKKTQSPLQAATARLADKQAESDSKIRRGALTKINEALFDDLLMADKVDRLAEKRGALSRKGGYRNNPLQSTYLGVRLLKGVSGKVWDAINNGLQNWSDPSKRDSESLVSILKPVRNQWKEFGAYLAAKRIRDDLAGVVEQTFTPAEAKAIIKDAEAKHPHFKFTAARIKKMNDGLIKYMVDSGYVTQETAENLMEASAYIPLKKLLDADEFESKAYKFGKKASTAQVAQVIKELGNSKSDIVDPLLGYSDNVMSIVTAVEKNDALRRFGRLSRFESMHDVLRPTEKGDVTDKNIIVYRDENGNVQRFKADPAIAEMLRRADTDIMDAFSRVLTAGASILRTGVTIDPAFQISNAGRDGVISSILSRDGGLPFGNLLRGWAMMLGDISMPNGKKAMDRFRSAKGENFTEQAYFNNLDPAMTVKANVKGSGVQKAIGWDPSKTGVSGTFKNLANVPSALLHDVQFVSKHLTELPARLGEYEKVYERAMKRGLSKKEAAELAAFESRDILDFSLGGTLTRKLKGPAAFFGARLAGFYRESAALNLARDPKAASKVIAKSLLYVTVPTILNALANIDNEDYWKKPQWLRDMAWGIHLGNGRFLWLPKPPGIIGYGFGTAAERMVQAFRGDKRWKDGAATWARETLLAAVPTALKPSLEVMANYKSFMDAPIVSNYMKDLPADQQYDPDSTSLTSRYVAMKMHSMGFDVSPMNIDHLIKSHTSAVGKTVVREGIDPHLSKKYNKPEPFKNKKDRSLTHRVMDRFISEPDDMESDTSNRFYKRFNPVDSEEKWAKANNQAPRTTDPEYKLMANADKQVKELRKQMREQPNLSRKERYAYWQRIEELQKPFAGYPPKELPDNLLMRAGRKMNDALERKN